MNGCHNNNIGTRFYTYVSYVDANIGSSDCEFMTNLMQR